MWRLYVSDRIIRRTAGGHTTVNNFQLFYFRQTKVIHVQYVHVNGQPSHIQWKHDNVWIEIVIPQI